MRNGGAGCGNAAGVYGGTAGSNGGGAGLGGGRFVAGRPKAEPLLADNNV